MMERQMRATDANAVKSTARFGATLNTAVQERLYVLVVAAFAAAGNVRREAGGTPRCASNLIGVARLAFPEQLVEITFRVTLPGARGEAAVVNFEIR